MGSPRLPTGKRRLSKWLIIPLLLFLVAIIMAVFIVTRVQFNEDYHAAQTAISERELYVIATARASGGN